MSEAVRVACSGSMTLPLEDLRPFQGNLKDLSEENYRKLRKEILELGFSSPFHVWRADDGKLYLLDGHQRLRTLTAMRKEGVEVPELPAVEVQAADVKEAKRKVLALTSQYGNMTSEGLWEFMKDSELELAEVMSSFRFPEIDLKRFQAEHCDPPPAGDDPGVGELPAEARTKKGDLIVLGRHRLLCGDTTSIGDVERLMQGKLADGVWTDPPYNVAYEGSAGKIQNDDMSDGDFRQFLRDSLSSLAACTKPGGAVYIAHADSEGENFRGAAREAGWSIRQCLIWKKHALVMGRQDYHWIHEPILYGWREGGSHTWLGDRTQTTVVEFDKPARSDQHPTMKPLELVEYCLKNSVKEGGLVLDGFGGSGTTLIACDRTGRDARLLELDPRYCDVIVNRWQELSGDRAMLLLGDGVLVPWL